MKLRTLTFAVSLALASACGVQNQNDRTDDASDAADTGDTAEGLDATSAKPLPLKVIARSDAYVKARSLKGDMTAFKATIDAILALEPGRTFMQASGQSVANAMGQVDAFQALFRPEVNDFTISNAMPNVRLALADFTKKYDAAVKLINSTSAKTTYACPTKKNPKKMCTKTAKLNTIPTYKSYVRAGGDVKKSAATFASYTLGGNATFDRGQARATLGALEKAFNDYHDFVYSDASQAGCQRIQHDDCPSWRGLSDKGVRIADPEEGSISDFVGKFDDGLNGDPVVSSVWLSLDAKGGDGDIDQFFSDYKRYKGIIASAKLLGTQPFKGFVDQGDNLQSLITQMDNLMKLAQPAS